MLFNSGDSNTIDLDDNSENIAGQASSPAGTFGSANGGSVSIPAKDCVKPCQIVNGETQCMCPQVGGETYTNID